MSFRTLGSHFFVRILHRHPQKVILEESDQFQAANFNIFPKSTHNYCLTAGKVQLRTSQEWILKVQIVFLLCAAFLEKNLNLNYQLENFWQLLNKALLSSLTQKLLWNEFRSFEQFFTCCGFCTLSSLKNHFGIPRQGNGMHLLVSSKERCEVIIV